MLKFFVTRISSLALLVAFASAVHAAPPPLKLVVGFAPGGGVDTLARILAQQLASPLGRAVVVENRPGAGGTIAADTVSRAAPDGNTLLFADTSLLLAPHIYSKVNFKTDQSFAPVAMLGQTALALVVPAQSPSRSLTELITRARNEPGQLTYATVGFGSMHHLAGELLKAQTGTDFVHVPYKGGGPATQAVAAGQVSSAISSLPPVISQADAGRVRILAVLSAQRFPGLPNTPSMSETLPGFDATPSLFLLAPAGTSPAALAELEAAVPVALRDPKVREAFLVQGASIDYRPAAELAEWLPKEERRWADLIKNSNLQFDQ